MAGRRRSRPIGEIGGFKQVPADPDSPRKRLRLVTEGMTLTLSTHRILLKTLHCATVSHHCRTNIDPLIIPRFTTFGSVFPLFPLLP